MLHYLKLVVPTRIELVMVDYQSTVIPFNYRTMVVPVGIEPTSTALQTAAMTTSAKVALVPRDGVEPPIPTCKEGSIPFT